MRSILFLLSLNSILLFDAVASTAPSPLLMEWGAAVSGTLEVQTPYRLMTWNIYKGGNSGLYEDYGRFVDEYDFVVTQEFLLNSSQEQMINKKQTHHWALAKSFQDGGAWTGVATVSKFQPQSSLPLKSPGNEPFSGTPKMSLISVYAIADGRSLMVVNVHGLNFDIGHNSFKKQITALVEQIKGHTGPMILAGDFNTWAETRRAHLLQKTQELGLSRAQLENPMGMFSATLDHIFYRDLQMIQEKVISDVSSSDHLPLVLEFKL
jgi:endonuclease/exonuclease/phosphatase (EEP) superfamily protein YafD